MLPDLLSNLIALWGNQFAEAGISLTPPLSAIQIGGAKGAERKVNFLVFNGTKDHPLVILKVGRSADYKEKLIREFESLKDISSVRALQNSVPSALGLFRFGENFVLAESFLPGVSLSVFLRRHQRIKEEQVNQDLINVLNWLTFMQQNTTSGKTVRLNERLVATLKRARKNSMELPSSFVGFLESTAETFRQLEIPLTGRHGDFWPGNLLIDVDRIHVIDWEIFRRDKLPFDDLFHFVITYAQTYPWDSWRWSPKTEGFRKAFLEHNWFSGAVRKCVVDYLQHFQLPSEVTVLLLSEFLIRRASAAVEQGKLLSGWFDVIKLHSERWGESIYVKQVSRS